MLVDVFFALIVIFILFVGIDFLRYDWKVSFLSFILTGILLILWYWSHTLEIFG